MSDSKKPEQKDPPKPLIDSDVDVCVIPKDGENPEHEKTAERIKENLAENIKKALEENKSGGKEKQFEAAESEVKKAKESADPQQVEEIEVDVSGKTNEEGDRELRRWRVTTKENKPKSP